MKRLLIISAILLSTTLIFAQRKRELNDFRRNSLTTMMIYHPEDEFGYNVWETYRKLPCPDQYDEHNIGLKVIDNSKIVGVKKGKVGLNRQEYGNNIILSQSEKLANANAILKILNKANCGTLIVARWFNLTGDSLQNAYFNTDYIVERGQYDVTALEAEMASFTVEGKAMLADAGEELISRSFILVNDMTYFTAQQRAKVAKGFFNVLGGIIDAATGRNEGERMAEHIADIADNFDGFKIMTHSYLYQLEWNDSIANIFYEKYYTEQPNPEKMRAFLQDTTLFRMKYVAQASSNFEKNSTKYGQLQLLRFITMRSIDNNIAVLQSLYEPFQVKTPIIEIEYNQKLKKDCYRAAIGMKEGIDDKTVFQVMKTEFNYKTGKMEYTEVAKLQPIKGQIWDNRFNAVQESDNGATLEGTLMQKISGSDQKIVKGMLLVRQKDKK